MSQIPDVESPPREPIFNLPGVVFLLIGVLLGLHLLREFVLTESADDLFLLTFAFIPQRYVNAFSPGGGEGALVWTFLTYAFIHGNFAHLIMNAAWLVPFGSALARRVGGLRFLAIAAIGAIAGAAFFLAFHFGETTLVIGASASVSAVMAAATRFFFTDNAPAGIPAEQAGHYYQPAPALLTLLGNRRFLFFNGMWFVINLATGLLGFAGMAIAWEAHIGGFLAGLLLFPLFDRIPRQA